MKIFNKYVYIVDKNKKKVSFDFYVPSRKERDFANSDIITCMMMIINRLQHVEFKSKIEFVSTTQIFDFLKENALQIMQRLFYDGYFVLNVESLKFRKIELKNISLIDSSFEIELNEDEICYFDNKYLS